MLKLLPAQIAKVWPTIRHGIVETFPVPSQLDNKVLERYLTGLLTGQRQCWVILNKDGNIAGVMITHVSEEFYTGDRTLNLDHLYAYEIIPQEKWDKLINTLTDFAVANKCETLSAITTNQRVRDLGSMYGFKEITCLLKEI